MEALLRIRDLSTQFQVQGGMVRAVDGVNLQVKPGEMVGVVGESGSGKSVTALSVLRLVPPPGRIVGGSITYQGRDVFALNKSELRDFRGGDVSMVFQDPMSSLNPALRIGIQIEEAMQAHRRFSRSEAKLRVPLLLRRVRMPDPERSMRSFPHQLSGGMRQRAMIAMALANEPGLVIADEPTTALDVTIQAQVLEQLRELNRQSGTAILLITHNMAVVASLCTWVVVMYAGRVVEQGPTDQIFQSPQHPYTWSLLRSIPRIDTGHDGALLAISGTPPDLTDLPIGCRFSPRCPFSVERCVGHEPDLIDVGPAHSSRCWVQMVNVAISSRDDIDSPIPGSGVDEVPRVSPVSQPVDVEGSPGANALVTIREVSKDFASGSLLVHAVDSVSLEIAEGETLGLVGESGSGKTTLGRIVAQLQPATRGDVFFDGRDLGPLHGEGLRQLRRRIQMIFQDPYSSLNPRMTVGAIIGEPVRNFGLADGAERTARVQEMMRICGLNPNFNNRYPHEFSGGQRQRVGIARSLILRPSFVVADEPISALDVSIQAQIINLLGELQRDLKLTYLFIAHDLAVVRHLSDRVAVMYLGIIVEVAECGELYANPLHPYTTSLLQAMPVPDPEAERRRAPILLQGEIPSPINPPSGCRFHTRCPIAEPICSAERPALVDYGSGHLAACHFPGKLQGSEIQRVAVQSREAIRAAILDTTDRG